MSAIPLSVYLLRRDGGTQPRGDLCSETVRQLAEALSAGEVLPPVVVFFDGADYWLADGFHRVAGTELAGLDLIDCDIRQGTQRDAILCSCGANKEHDSVGRRRSNADKRRAVERLLRDKEWSGWSDRRIAEHIGVSHNMVSEMRRLSSDDSRPQTRVGRDGRTTNVNGIGKTPNGIILNAGNRSALAGGKIEDEASADSRGLQGPHREAFIRGRQEMRAEMNEPLPLEVRLNQVIMQLHCLVEEAARERPSLQPEGVPILCDGLNTWEGSLLDWMDGKPLKTKARRASQKPMPEVPIPEDLDTPEIRQMWGDWMRFQMKKRGGKYFQSIAEYQMKRLLKLGLEGAAAALEYSLAGGYLGIIEPPQNGRTAKPVAAKNRFADLDEEKP